MSSFVLNHPVMKFHKFLCSKNVMIENGVPAWRSVVRRGDDDELAVGRGAVGESQGRSREGLPAHRAGVGVNLERY